MWLPYTCSLQAWGDGACDIWGVRRSIQQRLDRESVHVGERGATLQICSLYIGWVVLQGIRAHGKREDRFCTVDVTR